MGRLHGWIDEGWVFTGLTAGVFAAAVGTFASMPEAAVVVPASVTVVWIGPAPVGLKAVVPSASTPSYEALML